MRGPNCPYCRISDAHETRYTLVPSYAEICKILAYNGRKVLALRVLKSHLIPKTSLTECVKYYDEHFKQYESKFRLTELRR
jgi:hypothetical protein